MHSLHKIQRFTSCKSKFHMPYREVHISTMKVRTPYLTFQVPQTHAKTQYTRALICGWPRLIETKQPSACLYLYSMTLLQSFQLRITIHRLLSIQNNQQNSLVYTVAHHPLTNDELTSQNTQTTCLNRLNSIKSQIST